MSGVDSDNSGSLKTPVQPPELRISNDPDVFEAACASTQAARESKSLIGQTIDKRFRIVSPIGRGGMSEVFKAEHLMLQKFVAIKVLHQGQLGQANGIERFQQEAKAVSALDHPNIVKVYAFGCAENSMLYLVMDYLQGMSLSEILEADERLDWKRSVQLCIQVADGLAHAHARGIIHRDLKPSNVIVQVNEDGTELAKIVDFGVARLTFESGKEVKNLTLDGNTCGSPPYMSPEQCKGEPVDERSDVYSFGCMLYELLSGRRPFYGNNSMEVMIKHVEESPRPLKAVCSGAEIPQSLEAIVRKCLQKNPEFRYRHMSDLAADLRIVGSEGEAEKNLESSLLQESQKPLKKNLYLLPLALGLSALLIASAGFLAFKYSGELQSMKLRADIAGLEAGDPHRLDKLFSLTQQLFDAELKSDNQGAALKDAKGLEREVAAMQFTPQRSRYVKKIVAMYGKLGKREVAQQMLVSEINELEEYIKQCAQTKNESEYESACLAVLSLCGSEIQLQDTALGKINMLVSLYLAQNKLARAENAARTGLEIVDRSPNRNGLPKILFLDQLSTVLIAQGKLSEARANLEAAARLCVDNWGDDCEISRKTAEKLRQISLLESKK